jgi:hypothetical protein
MGTFIVGAIVLGILVSSVYSLVKDKRKGKSIQCGKDCNHCDRGCH